LEEGDPDEATTHVKDLVLRPYISDPIVRPAADPDLSTLPLEKKRRKEWIRK